MQSFSVTPREMVASFWRHRELTYALIKREVVGRYRGSFMGILWSFFNPLFMLAVYTFVFSVVFKARWGGGSDSKTEFALILFSGLLVFNLFSECINRAPGLVLANANYVKRVIFPLEILPLVTLGAALFHGVVSLGVWLLAYSFLYGIPHLTVLYLPVVLLPLAFFILGASWFLAAVGVYLRDIAQFIGVLTTVLLFLSPVFYAASSLPEAYRWLLFMNPLTPVIEQVRLVLFWGQGPDAWLLIMSLTVSVAVAWAGFASFQKARKGFADVI